jgi:hypothetical protein
MRTCVLSQVILPVKTWRKLEALEEVLNAIGALTFSTLVAHVLLLSAVNHVVQRQLFLALERLHANLRMKLRQIKSLQPLRGLTLQA